ncbi:hypothetical protein D9615_010733 [Tricholomella constricta]|uniref:Retrotransposon gag domain-containing protein n=1 Tax=Tricholomella constricta TaxID=117010 RepID=A0A8H5GJ25_9AGAR|nr:hypothetical protein D9615_010733 [Tricholomella constricta]
MSDRGTTTLSSQAPVLTPEQRLEGLETMVSALTTHHTSNSASMDRLFVLFESLLTRNPPAASIAANGSSESQLGVTPTPDEHRSMSRDVAASPPMSLPPIFDGSRSGGRAFLNACKLYMLLCPRHFPNEHARVAWVLSFMQHGRAADFVERVFQCATIQEAFPTWDDFQATFTTEFCPMNEVANAALALESSAYFQNGRTIDEYIDSFRSLRHKARYPDGRHLVMKFRRGMDPQLCQRLGTITTGRPHDEKIEEWLAMARSQDFIMRTEEEFLGYADPAPTPPTEVSVRAPTADDTCRHLEQTLDRLIMHRQVRQEMTTADTTPTPVVLPVPTLPSTIAPQPMLSVGSQTSRPLPTTSRNRFAPLSVEPMDVLEETAAPQTPSVDPTPDPIIRSRHPCGWTSNWRPPTLRSRTRSLH